MPRLRAGGGAARGATAAFVCAHLTVLRCCTSPHASQVTLATEGKANNPPISVSNTVVNICEVCDEEELTVKVLDIMRNTLNIKGNITTFNITLKRLANGGNVAGCKSILVGMLNKGLEPNVVSYTTIIGTCAKTGTQNAATISMWLERMRLRGVWPNYHMYNTVLAACPNGAVESTYVSTKIATDMLEDIEAEIACGLKGLSNFRSTLPDSYTKVLVWQPMKQLQENWRSGELDMALAKASTRVTEGV